MLSPRMSATLLLGAALVVTLTACGSEPADDTPASTSPSATAPSTGSSPEPSNSGIVPDSTWAAVFKKAVPPLADRSDEEVATAGRKVCTDFEASPDEATAKEILEEVGTTLGLDSTHAQVFTSGAITHFCTPQTDAWTQATLG